VSRRAIVVGASVSGLLASHALRPYFGRVTILDRDFLPSAPAFRTGVPQSRHVHQILRSALDHIEGLLPGFSADLDAAGAVRLDLSADIAVYLGSRWAPRIPSGIFTYGVSRELMEHLLRLRTLGQPGIELVEGCEVTGLVARTDGEVTGVKFRWRSRPGAGTETADLVVDASGQLSAAPAWLKTIGVMPPEEDTVSLALGYASCVVDPPPAVPDWKALYICAVPPILPRAGLIFPIENRKWLVTLSGSAGQHPSVSPDSFLDFARSLANPALWEMLQQCRALGPVSGFVRAETCLRRYDLIENLPDRFLLLGDSVARLNPVYGQGIATAAMAAAALHAQLSAEAGELSPEFARRFHSASIDSYRACWLLSTAQDRLFPGTQGSPVAAGDRRAIEAIQYMVRNAVQDPAAYLDFIRVSHLLRPVPSPEVVRG
jgi:2-polyprenyl-6-methoxyphenol hydroxylase-like FAD-dependent oxidoreductase